MPTSLGCTLGPWNSRGGAHAVGLGRGRLMLNRHFVSSRWHLYESSWILFILKIPVIIDRCFMVVLLLDLLPTTLFFMLCHNLFSSTIAFVIILIYFNCLSFPKPLLSWRLFQNRLLLDYRRLYFHILWCHLWSSPHLKCIARVSCSLGAVGTNSVIMCTSDVVVI